MRNKEELEENIKESLANIKEIDKLIRSCILTKKSHVLHSEDEYRKFKRLQFDLEEITKS